MAKPFSRIAQRLFKMRRQLTSGESNSPFPSVAQTKSISNSSHRLLAPKPFSTSENIPSFAGLGGDRAAIARHNDLSLTAINRFISATHSKEKNFVCSPLSLSVAISMIQLLLLRKSKSEDQLVSQILSDIFEAGRDDGPKLAAANGLWIDQSLELDHNVMQVVNDLYKATVKLVDFPTEFAEVTREVNSWVAKLTKGLINEILPTESVDSSTLMIFTNVVYFKGSWAERFNPRLTNDYPFHLINGCVVKAPFMTKRMNKYFVARFDGFKVLRLPYRKGAGERRFSMHIFLPDTIDGLSALVDKLSSGSAFVEKHIPTDKISVGLFMIPKFTLSCGFEALEVLKDLGRVPSSKTGIGPSVDKIFHKSSIEVKEQGTVAAAATAVVGFGATRPEMDFVADHPFVFVIREDVSGLILFAGQVVNPSKVM